MTVLTDILTELNKYRSKNINRIAVETRSMDYYTNMLYIAKQTVATLHRNNISIDDAMINIRKIIKND